MLRYTSYILPLVLLQPLMLGAQDISNAQLQQVQQSLQNTIKGTLDGVVQIPQFVQNKARPFVFPRSFNNAIAPNPWSLAPMQPRMMQQQGFNSIPKGNPWAPVGDTQNIPFDQSNMMGVEKNPYNDSGMPRPMMNRQPSPLSSGMFNNPYSPYPGQGSAFGNGFSNRAYDGSNGSFSSPFNNGFFPTNQFWPGGNNANGNFPFMPW